MNIWLMDEQPVVVDRGLARIIGFSEAVIITQLHQWIEYNKKHKKNYEDGYYWTYGSMEKWHEEYFDILGSIKTLRRVFKRLEKKGYLIVSNYNKLKFDKTSWYRVNYEKFNSLKKKYRDGQNDHTDEDEMTISQVDNLTTPIPNNKNIIKNNNISYHQSNNNIIYSEQMIGNDERLIEEDKRDISPRKKYNTQYFRDSFGYTRVSKNKQVELDKWIKYAVDICLMLPDTKLHIGKQTITAGVVAERLAELRYEHIDYIFTRLSQVSYPANHKNYMLAVLYNAKEQYESSKSTFTGGNNAQGRYVAPMPDYLQDRVNNRGRETKERIVTEEDEAAYNALMQELHGKERSDV
ncbi:hypothetical protein [uncultured Gemella sp.]|uniref:hypothetical protein n=1 Tax=uncultured Gemella sp. TaxID=254352 RepID=UPI0028EEDDF8|nr:hypothetical protein [uncultured Gemella sp.]